MGCKLWPHIKRPVFTVFSLLLVVMLFEFLFFGEFTPNQVNIYDYRDEWYESNSTICDLPLYMNPYDPIIKAYITKKRSKIECNKLDGPYDSLYNLYKGQSLSYMNDDDPIVRIFRIREREKSLKCLYSSFDRDGESDNFIKYSRKRPIIGHKLNLEKVAAEFVFIECFLSGKLVYTNTHSWPSRVPSQLINSQATKQPTTKTLNDTKDWMHKHNDQNIDPFKPSVMFLVIESMSWLNFKRFMHKTGVSLSKFSNHFFLRGLNKLADNSYPNMMPLLSGFRPYYGEWPFNVNVDEGPFDDVPFIWYDFKKNNYSTGYVEDDPYYGLFNYLAHGFKKPPVDWYPRPYWLKLRSDQGIETLSYCYKQVPKIAHWLKQVKQFLNKVHKTKQPFFLWSFYIQVTHNDFNNAQSIDHYIADFIDSYRHILEDTVFVVMGDHGNRFGPSLRTEYGQIESRMPLFSIHIPPKLLQRHEHLSHFLKLNEKKLTTWLDVREMLKDIVSGNYKPIVSSPSKRNAYSAWREEIPMNRNCYDALIPSEFCLCSKRHNLPVNSSIAQKASSIFLNKVNQALSKYSNLCHELSLKEIHNVKNVALLGQPDLVVRIEVTISVAPSNAVLQAQLYLNNSNNHNLVNKDNNWLIEGDISRLNAYGNQSICIDDRVLRKYCYCRNESRSP